MTRTRSIATTAHSSSARPQNRLAQNNENSMAMDLSATEIRADMIKILTYLKTNLDDHQKDTRSFLMTDAQALLYAERTASYALHDYPRQFEGDSLITFLWDTFNGIVRTVVAWRTGKSGGDGQVELAIIKKNINFALAESQRVMRSRNED